MTFSESRTALPGLTEKDKQLIGYACTTLRISQYREIDALMKEAETRQGREALYEIRWQYYDHVMDRAGLL